MAREEAEIKDLSEKLAKNPESLVFAPLADAHRRLKRYEEAIQICLKGLETHPHYMTARVVLGRAYLENEMLDEAGEEFRKVIHADPNHAMAHGMLGQIYSRQGQFTKAVEEHQAVLAINPDDAATQSLLQEAMEWARQPGRQASPGPETSVKPAAAAPPSAAKVPSSTPVTSSPAKPTAQPSSHDAEATMKVAEIYIKKGALDEAIEVFEEVLASDPGNRTALTKLMEIRALKDAKNTPKPVASSAPAAPSQAKPAPPKEEAPKPASPAKSSGQEGSPAEAFSAPVSRADEKITSDDIFSALDLGPAKPAPKKESPPPVPAVAGPVPSIPVPAASPVAQVGATEMAPHPSALLADFNRTSGIEGSLFIDRAGKVLEGSLSGISDLPALGLAASTIFSNTEKAVSRMKQGKLNQIMISGEDGRQIVFAQLKTGILAALASKNANFGLLRIALHELARKAA
jgi:predicted regulator of Ras-like GTPase activity (Roadblock/LC7/MglB family)/cytochrome c-type biogenesis protein CcmH/NrfG